MGRGQVPGRATYCGSARRTRERAGPASAGSGRGRRRGQRRGRVARRAGRCGGRPAGPRRAAVRRPVRRGAQHHDGPYRPHRGPATSATPACAAHGAARALGGALVPAGNDQSLAGGTWRARPTWKAARSAARAWTGTATCGCPRRAARGPCPTHRRNGAGPGTAPRHRHVRDGAGKIVPRPPRAVGGEQERAGAADHDEHGDRPDAPRVRVRHGLDAVQGRRPPAGGPAAVLVRDVRGPGRRPPEAGRLGPAGGGHRDAGRGAAGRQRRRRLPDQPGGAGRARGRPRIAESRSPPTATSAPGWAPGPRRRLRGRPACGAAARRAGRGSGREGRPRPRNAGHPRFRPPRAPRPAPGPSRRPAPRRPAPAPAGGPSPARPPAGRPCAPPRARSRNRFAS